VHRLIKNGLIIKKPEVVHSRSRALRHAEARRKGRHTGYGQSLRRGTVRELLCREKSGMNNLRMALSYAGAEAAVSLNSFSLSFLLNCPSGTARAFLEFRLHGLWADGWVTR
jgi:hypothetical protein